MKIRLRLLVAAICLAMLPSVGHAQAENQIIRPEWEEAGVIEPGSYLSPSWQYQINWSGDWIIDPRGMNSVVSRNNVDGLILTSNYYLTIAITAGPLLDLDLDDSQDSLNDLVATMESGDFFDDLEPGESLNILHAEAKSSLATVAVLSQLPEKEPTISLFNARMTSEPGGLILSVLICPAETFDEHYSHAANFVTIDGVQVVDGLSNNDREAIVEEALAIASSEGDESAASSQYLEEVAEHVAFLQASQDRFRELFFDEPDPSQADIDEIFDIVDAWDAAESHAENLDTDPDFDEISEVYFDYTDAYSAAAEAFDDWRQSEPGSVEDGEAYLEFVESLDDANELGDELIDLLEEEGVELPEVEEDNDGIDSSFI